MEDSQGLPYIMARTLSNQQTLNAAGPRENTPKADDIEQSKEYNVDEVLGSTNKGHSVLYLVKWLDYPDRKD